MIEQTHWFERKFDFSFPVGIFPVIIERLRGTVPRIGAMIQNCSEDIMSLKRNGEWSAKEQIGHLYDLEDLWYGRIEDFRAGLKTLRPADLQNRKTHEANHNGKPMAQLLEQFSVARTRLVNSVEGIDEETAVITALHPRLQTPMRLIDSLFFIAEHDDHHLAKMRALLE